MNQEKELWELYPHIWKTKAAFFNYIRGAIRRALWERYPVKLEFKNENMTPPPPYYKGRGKSGAICALSSVFECKSKLEVDHIVGNQSLQDWDDLLPFIKHLCATKDQLQLVTKEAHKIKSYADRHGITYEQAQVVKEAIQICKGDEKLWLSQRGTKPESNAKKRRAQVEKLLTAEILPF